MYSVELIYYFIMKYWPQLSLTVFGEYIKNPEILREKYPDLYPSAARIKNMYSLNTIVGKNYVPETDKNKWDIPLFIGITYSVISVTEQYLIPGSLVYLRNLFDQYVLDELVNYSVCRVELEGRYVSLTKHYKTTKYPHLSAGSNTIFNIQIPEHGSISLIISNNGIIRYGLDGERIHF